MRRPREPIFILAALAVLMMLSQRTPRPAPNPDPADCEQNKCRIVRALTDYASDHPHEAYPDNLSELVPRYLRSIPKCPQAKADTYSACYHVSCENGYCTLGCSVGHGSSYTGALGR